MAYVGDVILSGRELMTDLPQTLPAPTLTGFTNPAGGFPVGTYYVVATLLTIWGGETSISNELLVSVAAFQTFTLAYTLPGSSGGTTPPSWVTGMRVYYGSSPGAENQYFTIPLASINGSFTPPTAPFTTTVQNPPSRSSAYNPDTDGAAVSVGAIYRWLNQGLKWAAAKNRGGLPDFGAVGTVNGQPNYVLPGYWRKIDSAWFDGYPLGLLSKNNVYRRNPVPGYSGMLIVFQATDRLMVEAWPQPNRTSGQSTLSAPMTATDTVANLASTSGYVLGFGMTQIDSEIVNFAAINGNQLTGLQRGMCGTVPAAHSTSAPTTELNLMIAGYRVPSTTYAVGQAATTFYLPPGWDEALSKYLLYRFRKAEQDEQGASTALKEAEGLLTDLSANRIIAGPRQIQPYAAIGPEVGAGLGTAFGGVLIP